MPAVTVEDLLVLPRLPQPVGTVADRRVGDVVTAHQQREGAGIMVRRPFPSMSMQVADPFLLMDHFGETIYQPHEIKGAPWHPHRGFETVTYVIDGTLVHHDSNGGGGVIADGATQWMTAGSGILHDEAPSEEMFARGGLSHGVQLWVNLPRALKWVQPRYQDIQANELQLLTSHDGGVLVRLIAGKLGGYEGPGMTYTPITYAHASLLPDSQLHTGWDRSQSAMVYVLQGSGTVGTEKRPLKEGQLAIFGPGDAVTVDAGPRQHGRTGRLEVLLLGGRPLNEPVARYGPFVMNTDQEIHQAVEDYQRGRMGHVPAINLDPKSS
ncbi:pirin family protein [Streptomyces sp. NPDC059909]|uniref:pirin family protein n=1 Tax=Streptomyces sp. NPDC059909 TaxID=3346998 RepID=UPI003668415F